MVLPCKGMTSPVFHVAVARQAPATLAAKVQANIHGAVYHTSSSGTQGLSNTQASDTDCIMVPNYLSRISHPTLTRLQQVLQLSQGCGRAAFRPRKAVKIMGAGLAPSIKKQTGHPTSKGGFGPRSHESKVGCTSSTLQSGGCWTLVSSSFKLCVINLLDVRKPCLETLCQHTAPPSKPHANIQHNVNPHALMPLSLGR